MSEMNDKPQQELDAQVTEEETESPVMDQKEEPEAGKGKKGKKEKPKRTVGQ